MMSHTVHGENRENKAMLAHGCPQYQWWGFEVSASMSHKLSRPEERQPPACLPPPSLESTEQADKVEQLASRSDARACHSSDPVGARAK